MHVLNSWSRTQILFSCIQCLLFVASSSRSLFFSPYVFAFESLLEECTYLCLIELITPP